MIECERWDGLFCQVPSLDAFTSRFSARLRHITAECTAAWFTVKADSTSFVDTIDDKLTQHVGRQLAHRIRNGTLQKISFGGQLFQLCHFAPRSWNGSRKAIALNLETSHIPQHAHFGRQWSSELAVIDAQVD